jgi:hypothetical protein
LKKNIFHSINQVVLYLQYQVWARDFLDVCFPSFRKKEGNDQSLLAQRGKYYSPILSYVSSGQLFLPFIRKGKKYPVNPVDPVIILDSPVMPGNKEIRSLKDDSLNVIIGKGLKRLTRTNIKRGDDLQ